ncbi:aminotransferase class V-fold PLP-dependent enzyme [Nocardioides sp. HDW12B]|uniref:aminotransferase class V-fold PLP-dependent enzyme n=1 Tax=Nocardioides sp. HDW12B TaxID=2714939 RepID=UPI00140D7082|nr:aminotransferase class V-fold PLP-dependent enzyme [Nocardioides sp. HDW12B]QIK67194.1 aminotransferase class V-fold PLP-dependent enzyme [Nocardioides sp. HDW12B]
MPDDLLPDLDRLRADTPGTETVVHLNNAGSALPTRQVLDTVVGHLRREAEIGGYEAQWEVADEIEAVYAAVAALLGAETRQVALTDSATRSWDLAVYGYPFEPGDRVLVSRQEYASNAISLLHLRDRLGVEVVLVEDDDHGQVSLDALERELRRGAAMVSLVHVPTSNGVVNPAEAVGAQCREHDVFYVLDACQSVGQLPVDVTRIGCDVLAATGRKYLRAPRGTGLLHLSDRAMERLSPPFLDLHAATWVADDAYELREDARRFETWERSTAGVLGLGVASRYLTDLGPERTWDRVRALAAALRERLAEVPGVVVRDRGEVLGGIVTFTVQGRAATEVGGTLRGQGINTSVTSATSARLDLGARGLAEVVRASVHYYNTETELDTLVAAVRRLA